MVTGEASPTGSLPKLVQEKSAPVSASCTWLNRAATRLPWRAASSFPSGGMGGANSPMGWSSQTCTARSRDSRLW